MPLVKSESLLTSVMVRPTYLDSLPRSISGFGHDNIVLYFGDVRRINPITSGQEDNVKNTIPITRQKNFILTDVHNGLFGKTKKVSKPFFSIDVNQVQHMATMSFDQITLVKKSNGIRGLQSLLKLEDGDTVDSRVSRAKHFIVNNIENDQFTRDGDAKKMSALDLDKQF